MKVVFEISDDDNYKTKILEQISMERSVKLKAQCIILSTL